MGKRAAVQGRSSPKCTRKQPIRINPTPVSPYSGSGDQLVDDIERSNQRNDSAKQTINGF